MVVCVKGMRNRNKKKSTLWAGCELENRIPIGTETLHSTATNHLGLGDGIDDAQGHMRRFGVS